MKKTEILRKIASYLVMMMLLSVFFSGSAFAAAVGGPDQAQGQFTWPSSMSASKSPLAVDGDNSDYNAYISYPKDGQYYPTPTTVSVATHFTAPNVEEWLAVDLGDRYDLSSVQLYWPKVYYSNNAGCAAESYTLESSDDGRNWSVFFTKTNGTFSSSISTPYIVNKSDFSKPAIGRFIRLHMTKPVDVDIAANGKFYGWCYKLLEIEALGTPVRNHVVPIAIPTWYQQYGTVANTIDIDVNNGSYSATGTSWKTKDSGAKDFVTYDLGADYPIDEITVDWGSQDAEVHVGSMANLSPTPGKNSGILYAYAPNAPNAYYIEYSTTGTTWTKFGDASYTKGSSLDVINGSARARYIRIKADSSVKRVGCLADNYSTDYPASTNSFFISNVMIYTTNLPLGSTLTMSGNNFSQVNIKKVPDAQGAVYSGSITPIVVQYDISGNIVSIDVCTAGSDTQSSLPLQVSGVNVSKKTSAVSYKILLWNTLDGMMPLALPLSGSF